VTKTHRLRHIAITLYRDFAPAARENLHAGELSFGSIERYSQGHLTLNVAGTRG
jgi:hypothetical protein